MTYKTGDLVRYRYGDTRVYTVIDVQGDKVSLSLAEYGDTEQDYYTDVNEIEKV